MDGGVGGFIVKTENSEVMRRDCRGRKVRAMSLEPERANPRLTRASAASVVRDFSLRHNRWRDERFALVGRVIPHLAEYAMCGAPGVVKKKAA